MCIEIYVGSSSDKDLSQDDTETGFWVQKTEQSHHPAIVALGDGTVYEIGSFMGCACGFSFGEWSKNDADEEDEKRRINAKALKDFLLGNQSSITKIVTFRNFTHEKPEEFPKITLSLGSLEAEEFEFEDDVLYEINWHEPYIG